jgi:exodeoxyribonuclease-3
VTDLTIATWNINSVRLRIATVEQFLRDVQPDVLCLQEIKGENGVFPVANFEALGYTHQAVRGMKSYNGVATLSRHPMTVLDDRNWCSKVDCRHVGTSVKGVEIHNFYVPAGGDIPDPAVNEKFAHKLMFLDEVREWFATERPPSAAHRMVLVGDLNIAPLEHDVWSHKKLLDVVSHTPIEVEKYEAWRAASDFRDAVRHFVPDDQKLYSWWSYRAKDWEAANKGRRLDHIWVTPDLVPGLKAASIHKALRGVEKASDHVPVVVTMTV